jgi:predicted nucleic acid-binding protein
MVLIDTSVWISLYRKKPTPIGELIWMLVTGGEAAVCGQTLVEFLGGFRKQVDFQNYKDRFQALPFIESTLETFLLAAELHAAEPSFGPGDAVIAATAIQSKTPLLSLDQDFKKFCQYGLDLFPIDRAS